MAHGHASVMAKPWTPYLLSPKLWLDAADSTTITASSGAVSQWNDKSGNGYAFTQATSTAQPTTGTKTQNSLNVLSFDGGDSLVSTAAASVWKFLHDGTQYLAAIVANRDVAGTAGSVMHTFTGGATTGAGFRWLAADQFSHYIQTSNTVISVSNIPSVGTSTATRLFTIFSKPSVTPVADRSSMWIDNGTVQKTNTFNATPTTADPTTTLWVGNRGGTGLPLTGTIAEIVIVTGSAVTDSNRTLLHDYLNKKWAVY